MRNLALKFLCTWFMVSTNNVANSQLLETLKWSWNTEKMPYKASDAVGTFVQGPNGDEDGFIILTGGCDHVNGNERAANGIDFECGSVTKRALKFDPFKNAFTELELAPRGRYRHVAIAIEEKVYLVGGRNLTDALVEEIDVYDTKGEKWSTVGKLPNVNTTSDVTVTSDLTAWAHDNHIYVTGGYRGDYTALSTTYKIAVADLTASSETNIVTSTVLKPMSSARGDMHSVEYEGYVYVFGGFSSDDWCKPLNLSERYHIKSDTWESLETLQFDRADMAVTELFGKIMVIGGESKPYGCRNDPAEGSIPQNHVEVYDPLSMKWLLYTPFQDYRFRFGAVAVKAQGRVYTFGGQLHYNKECNCFPSSNEVGIAQENLVQAGTSTSSGLSIGAVVGIALGSVAGALVIVSSVRYFMRSEKMVDTAMLNEPEEKA